MTERRFIFIVGCQRSGTTLIGQILGAHPACLFIDEDDQLYTWLDQTLKGPLAQQDGAWQQLVKKANRKYRADFKRIDQHGDIENHVTHVVLKAPNATYSVNRLREQFPDAAYVFATRDIRDIVCSMDSLSHIPMVDNQLRRITEHPDLCARFSEEVERLRDPMVALHRKRALVAKIKMSLLFDFQDAGLDTLRVPYEDLVQDIERWCRKLTAHVGLPFDAVCMEHEKVFQGLGPGRLRRSRPVDKNSVARWTLRLAPHIEREIWDECKGLMRTLGYRRDVQQKSLRTTLPAAVLDRPVIATGRGGSGTRLISTILQHLGVFLGTRINVSMDSMQWVELIHEMAAKLPALRPAVQAEPWRDILREQAAWVLTVGGWDGHSPWGWKLPETMLIVPEAYAAFPEARFIHMIRHPLDSCLRRDHVTSRPDNPVGRAVLRAAYTLLGEDPKRMWSDEAYLRNAVSYHLQVGSVARFCRASLSPDQYLELRYEDLCSTPEHTTRNVAAFLEISNPVDTPDLSIAKNRMRRWSIDDPRVAEVWEICGRVGEMLGYEMPSDAQ